MKHLKNIIEKGYRVIEFSSRKRFIERDLLPGDLFLSITRSNDWEDDQTVCLPQESFIRAIKQNSTEVIVLNCAGWVELKALQNTAEARFFLERITPYNFLFLAYFLAKGTVNGRQKFGGLFYLKRGRSVAFYLGVKRRKIPGKTARRFLSPLIGLEHFFRKLNDRKIHYCILRWFEHLPEIEENEDVDMMVDDDDLDMVHSIIEQRPGIVPLDIYSKSGMPGSDFHGVPYYVFFLAEKTLRETVLHNDTYKVPTWENYFLLLAYHSIFHKGESSGLISKKYDLRARSKPEHDYLFYLKTILSRTNLVVEEWTLEGLHAFLDAKGCTPPLDTLYKLSIHNPYLKSHLDDIHGRSEYMEKYRGLVCFVAREKVLDAGLFDDLKKLILKEGFTILRTVELENSIKEAFAKRVRGGNWCQGPWPSSGGLPAVLLVALDVYPVEPDSSDLQQHPGLTNRRIQNKNEIRDFLNSKLPSRMDWFNGIHSSDNEIQAVEYLSLAGLDKEEIYEDIHKLREAFITEYPVVRVMSQYSKRAKVELVLYKGMKAVKKTFKPGCEWALENEKKAYSVFTGIINTPQLLEIGSNYIITSFIEGSRSLGRRIGIQTLKRCLYILRKIYDCGYSILDFKPDNFLLDKDREMYIFDFEYLYEYEEKPSFLECYDLYGIPENIDLLFVPNNHVPKGGKPFDTIWTKVTGITHEELHKLEDFKIYLKSFYRYYLSKIVNKSLLFKENGKNAMKAIHRALP